MSLQPDFLILIPIFQLNRIKCEIPVYVLPVKSFADRVLTAQESVSNFPGA